MKIVFGFVWGIWWWRTSEEVTRVSDCVCGIQDIEECTGNLGVLKVAGARELLELGWRRGIPAELPLDVVVLPGGTHRATKSVVRHASSGDIKPGTLCKIGHGQFVFTPEVCFCQIAGIIATQLKGRIDQRFLVVVIARLGIELCGSYSLSTSSRGLLDRHPLTDVAHLVATAYDHDSRYGKSRTWQALRWVVDGSRSPKETDLYLIFCLPGTLGGFGLPRPELNHQIDVTHVTDGFFAEWKSPCTVDFYWAYARLVVEYDSKAYHDDLGSAKTSTDGERAAALRDLGYKVVTVRHDDLYDEKRLRAKAAEIARVLTVDLPTATGEFLELHRKLINMLLRHDRWI